MNERLCAFCQSSLEGMRPHAVYCSRSCKSKAAHVRFRDNGTLRKRDKARYLREAEHRRAYARAYSKANPEKNRVRRSKRRALTRGSLALLTDWEWDRLVRRFCGRCAYCSSKPSTLQMDHVIPLSRGGLHTVGNVLPACPKCNFSKRDNFLVVWRLRGGENH